MPAETEIAVKPAPALAFNKVRRASATLKRIEQTYSPAALASSFSIEDMVVTDLIAGGGLDIEIFAIDTGRLPEETHRMMEMVQHHYGRLVKVYLPDHMAVETYVKDHGANGFFDSVELRQACCHIRKVEPLRRALAGKRAWITGMRRTQSATRTNLAVSEHDTVHGLRKFNPLATWSLDEVWAYIRRFNVPYSPLYDQGYASIGCAPCTRPITPGEDIRAGRWWWEDPDGKECGLHPRGAAP